MNSIEAWTHKLLEQPVLTRCRIEVDYTLCCSFTDKCKKTKQEASAKYAALSCNKGVFRFKIFFLQKHHIEMFGHMHRVLNEIYL